MSASFDRKIDRIIYYLRNIARDAAPQGLFRKRLPSILKTAARYDRDYLRRRLDYYNQLTSSIPPPSHATTVGRIPMDASMYYYDLKEHARYFPRSLGLNCLFGDVKQTPDLPSIVKVRPIEGDNQNAIVMKLVKFRHFYLPRDPLPFREKKPLAVWRGGQKKNNPRREALVRGHRNGSLCDVGYTRARSPDVPTVGFLRPDEQMAFKYVISIEGNDVATNLKWILGSNSLCLQPRPRLETWFMEGRLDAGRHYVEVRDDFEDLEERIEYYERHEDEALEIIRNANAHAAQFLDEDRERLLSLLVLARYFAATGQLPADPAVADLVLPASGA